MSDLWGQTHLDSKIPSEMGQCYDFSEPLGWLRTLSQRGPTQTGPAWLRFSALSVGPVLTTQPLGAQASPFTPWERYSPYATLGFVEKEGVSPHLTVPGHCASQGLFPARQRLSACALYTEYTFAVGETYNFKACKGRG